MPQITGKTRMLAILADPIHHVKTPQRINALFEDAGIDAVMVPLHVPADGLAATLAGLRRVASFDGCVVTVPHKQAAVPLCDELSDAARQVGAVNVIRRLADGRLRGDILDGTGFVAGLRSAGIEPAGRSVYLAGAGGAANAIAFALAAAGVARLTLHNRTRDKAQALADGLRLAFPALPVQVGSTDPSGHDMVVNATSLGLRPGDALPLDAGLLHPSQTVAEIIMEPAETALLQAAGARGCRVHPGLPMLVEQVRWMAAFLLDRPVGDIAA